MEALGGFKRAIVPGITFDGEQMKVVGDAFERAWMLLEPGLTDRGGDITNNRTKLAKAVLSAARQGVEPSEALAKKALRVMFSDPV